jgi:hypothetical protein
MMIPEQEQIFDLPKINYNHQHTDVQYYDIRRSESV